MAAVDDAQRPAELATGQGHGAERAGQDFLAEHGLGQQGDSGPDLDALLDVLDVVELEDDLDVHVALAQEAIDLTADSQPLVEGDVGFPIQLPRMDRGQFGQPVPRWAGDDHFLLAPGQHGQITATARERQQAEVGLALADVLVDLGGVEVINVDLHVRMLGLEAGPLRR